MSDFGNIRNALNSVVSDDSARNPDAAQQHDTDALKFDKFQEDENFDSGILSEPISELLSSEIDLEPSVSVEHGRSIVVTELPRIVEQKLPSDCCAMGLNATDSGIDVDVSERIGNLRIGSCDPLQKSTNQSLSCCTEARPSESSWEWIFDQDEDGDTTLHVAILEKKVKLVTKILQIVPHSRYLDIANDLRQTSLHLSVLTGQSQITRLLFLAGAKLGLEDMNGNTALHLATAMNNKGCLEALLAPITVYEQTYVTFDHKPVIDQPIEYINEYNYDGVSCVHMAAKHYDHDVLRELLKRGADVNIGECKGGYTVLHEAAQCGNSRLVEFVLEHRGVNVNKKNYARLTPYQLSSRHPYIRQLLMDRRADCALSTDDESTDDSDSDDYSDSDAD